MDRQTQEVAILAASRIQLFGGGHLLEEVATCLVADMVWQRYYSPVLVLLVFLHVSSTLKDMGHEEIQA